MTNQRDPKTFIWHRVYILYKKAMVLYKCEVDVLTITCLNNRTDSSFCTVEVNPGTYTCD